MVWFIGYGGGIPHQQQFIVYAFSWQSARWQHIWDFKEASKENEVNRKLFDLLNEKLEVQGVITHKNSIVDVSFVTVTKRHTTKKGDESFFGFKDHVKCDIDSKIITDFSVTDASIHDSQKSL